MDVISRESTGAPVTAHATTLAGCDNGPRSARADPSSNDPMSTVEKWMYRVIAVLLLLLFAAIAAGHIPKGG
jgi:hypothetical protein